MKKKTFNEFLADFNVIQQVPKSWKEEREKAVKNIPFVVDINPEDSRRKDQKQYEMYRDSYYSGY